MENTIAYFGLKDEDDYMYKKAEAKTEERLQKRFEQNQRFSVIRSLDTKAMTEEQIMNVLDVTKEFVQSIQMDLAAAPKKIARMKKSKAAEQIAQELNLPLSWVEKFMS
jgi:hypothetical protein